MLFFLWLYLSDSIDYSSCELYIKLTSHYIIIIIVILIIKLMEVVKIKDTAKIKKYNMNRIRSIFRGGGTFSKQQIALSTGLSIATCNNFLNELEESGEITGRKKHVSDVGRSSKVYEINADFHYIACLSVKASSNQKIIQYEVKNLLSQTVFQREKEYSAIDYKQIEMLADELVQKFPQVYCLSISIPGSIKNDIINQCDIPELLGENLSEQLKEHPGVDVCVTCDMHLAVYGYYKKECEEYQSVSMLTFSEGIWPGAGSLVSGQVIEGAHNFAGMIAFLPYGINPKEQLEKCNAKNSFRMIVHAVSSVIALINPSIIILTGDLVEDQHTNYIYGYCLEYIPKEYVPELIYIKDIEPYIFEGLYVKAIEKITKGEYDD